FPQSRQAKPAHRGGARPGVEAAAVTVGALGAPHLLERSPAVRKTASEQITGRIAGHEAAVHLQAAPVGIPRVPPRSFVAMDTKPGAPVRRGGGRPGGPGRRANPAAPPPPP